MEPQCLNAENCLFVMVDLQERLLPVMDRRASVLNEALRLLRCAETLNIPVLATEQYPAGLGATVEPLAEFLAPERTFSKKTFSCWGAPGFEEALAALRRRQTVIFGIESHICVLATALEFLRRGFVTVAAEEACSSRKREHHNLAMDNLLAAGAAVLPTESIVYQLLGRAGTPQFKALLPLFK